MAHGLFLVAYCQHRIFSTESSQVACGQSAEAVGNDGTDRHQVGSTYSLLGKEAGYIGILRSQRNRNIVFFHLVLFSLCCNLGHCLHGFHRILAISCFTAQHQGVRTVIDCIGNIRYFSTGRTRIVDHCVQHLGSNDHRFSGQDTFLDQLTLDTRNTFLRHFDTQVTAGNHHTVCHFQDFIDVVHTFLVFNLGNDLDVAAILIQDLTDVKHVLTVTDERVCNEVNILFDGIKNVVAVFFSQ